MIAPEPPDDQAVSAGAGRVRLVDGANAGPYRLHEAARLLGVSDDTMRRWGDQGRFPVVRAPGGAAISGTDLARLAVEQADLPDAGGGPREVSARNRFRGIVTKVIRDTVMAQVEMCCGPHRIVSLMSREAADDLQLAPGVLAVAAVKATTVVVEIPR